MPKENPGDQITRRKLDHIEICCSKTDEIQMDITTGFEDIEFIHNAAPEINFKDINIETKFLDKKFSSPLLISSMTGGTASSKINTTLAKVAAKMNIGMGVGSQRAAIENQNFEESFSVIRKYNRDNFIAANLGAIQLNNNYSENECLQAIKMINADALILHLNPLQEVIQPEGDTNFANLITKITKIVNKIEKPIIIKEVGSGLSFELVEKLRSIGITTFDIAGAGGTSWSLIEGLRAKKINEEKLYNVGKLFKNWGIPTARNLIEISKVGDKVEVIASGGIRNGLEAAKALALGANLVGVGLPLGCLANSSTEKQIINWINQFIYELKTAMFLVGAVNLTELQTKPLITTGRTAEKLKARGFDKIIKRLSTRGYNK